MERTIALAGIIFFGLHLISRIRFFIENRGTKIHFIHNTIDIFISMGILVLSYLQLRGIGADGVTANYTWYILGLLCTYVLWVRGSVKQYRNRTAEKNQKHKKNRRK